MKIYKRHRFPPDIISYAVWLPHRFNLSHRDIEDLLAERGITASRESIRHWCIKVDVIYARRLKRKRHGYGDTFYIEEVFVKINGKQHYLWRAVEQDGEVVDVYLQAKRNRAAHLELMPDVDHCTERYENNRTEQSHEATRVRERGMRKFKSMKQAQRFVIARAVAVNLFNRGRHLIRADHYRSPRTAAFEDGVRVVA